MKRLLTVFLVALPSLAHASPMDSFYDQMKFLSQRDRVISENIANADTPKYRPKELKKTSSTDGDFSISMTNSRHMDLDGDSAGFELTKASISEIKPNGNAVTLENELFKKSENALRLAEATNLYTKSRAMLKTAITGNK